MDWDGIKYIFQIPISWYRKIHNMVFHAYGTNFLTVREGYYGGLEVGVDSDGFAEEVKRAVDLSGYVKSVDDQKPDLSGNVDLSGYVKTIDEQEPDEDGNVDLSGYVKTIDGEEPDLSGNIDLSDYYVTLDTDQTISGYKVFENVVTMSNGLSAHDADIYVDETNKLNIDQDTAFAVNVPLVQLNDATNVSAGFDIYPQTGTIGIYPHSGSEVGGSIDFHTNGADNSSSRVIDLSDGFLVGTTNKPLYLYTYHHNPTGIAISADSGQYHQLLTNEPSRLYSDGADNQIASRGYARLNFSRTNHTHGNIANNGQITADSGATPTNYYIAADSNGNLFRKDASGLAPSLSGYVTKDELTDYVQQSELTNYVTQSEITDFVTQSQLANYVTQSEITDFVTQSELADYVTQSDLADYVQQSELANYVTQNDLADYVTQSELANYATQDDIDGVIDSVEEELTAYAKTSDFASGFPAATQNGKTIANMKVITDVTWNGTTLQYKYRNLSFTKGLLTTYTAELTTTIDTPTVITWA